VSRVTRAWRGAHPGIRVALVAVAGFTLLVVGVQFLDSTTGGAEPDLDGRASASTLSRAPGGASAYRELLGRFGFGVRVQRGDLTGAELDPVSDTLVVLDAGGASDGDAAALTRFVWAGGDVVVAGYDGGLLDGITGGTAGGTPAGRPERIGAPGGRAVAEVGDQRFRVAAPGLAIWADEDRRGVAIENQAGPGTVRWAADVAPFLNRNLSRADNAGFAVAITTAAAGSRRVVIAEGVHGHGRATGLGAVPSRWRYALVAGLLAALLTMVAAGRRLGPPEDDDRDLGPGRERYAIAVGAALERTRHAAEVVAPLQAAARFDLARRVGLPPDAGEAQVREAAARLGWGQDEIDALFVPAGRPDAVVAAGRAAVRAREGTR